MPSVQEQNNQPAPPAISVDQFLESLSETSLLSAEDVKAVLAASAAAHKPDLRKLAQELVRQEKLTRYQASMAFQGKAKGLILGNYVILDKIGQGGMGVVFKAQHRRMKRLVALKILTPGVTKSHNAVQRFQREVEAMAKLSHPNIVTAFDASEDKGVHYLVMEYVEGSDLAALVKKRGPLSVAQGLNCLLQAAQGLKQAHAAGIIHRDIKPSNLLLDTKGTVKILDMGLARIDAGNDSGTPAGNPVEALTQSGSIMGTCDFMSPEQALNTKHADQRSDVYSLGCTLYYVLTGKLIAGGETMMEKLMAHQSGLIPALCHLRPEVSPSLEAVYQKMVAKAPADRFQTMDEVISSLEQCKAETNQADSLKTLARGQIVSGYSAETFVDLGRESSSTMLRTKILPPRSGKLPRPSRFGTVSPLVRLAVGGGLALLLVLVTTLLVFLFLHEPPAPVPTVGPAPVQDGAKLVSNGTTLRIVTSTGETVKVKDLAEAAASKLNITTVDLKGHRTLTDGDLALLEKFPHLERLDLSGTNVSDEGLETVGKLNRLEELVLDSTDITDAGLNDLKPLTRLRKLSVNATLVTAKALRALAGMKLESFAAYRTDIGDLDLPRGLPLKHLRYDFVTKADLNNVRSLKGLETINGVPAAQFLQEVGKTGTTLADLRKAWEPVIAAPLLTESDLNPSAVQIAQGQYCWFGGRIEPKLGLQIQGQHTHSVVWWNAAVGHTFVLSVEFQSDGMPFVLWGGPGYGNGPDGAYNLYFNLKDQDASVWRGPNKLEPKAKLGEPWQMKKWYHAEVVREPGSIRLFVEGTLAAQWEDLDPFKGPLHEFIGLGSFGDSTFRDLKVLVPAWTKERRQPLLSKKTFDPPPTVPKARNGKLLFDDNFIDGTPLDNWRTTNDPDAVKVSPRGLELTGPNSWPQLWRKTAALTGNFAVECLLSYHSDKEPDNFRLMLRKAIPANNKDMDDGYVVSFADGDGFSRIWQRHPDGGPAPQQLARVPYYLPLTDRSYLLRLERVGGRLRVFSNDRFLLEGHVLDAPPAETSLSLGLQQAYSGSIIRQVRAWALE